MSSQELLEPQTPKDSSKPGYKRVSGAEAAKMFRLYSEGVTQERIAQQLTRSTETVSRVLSEFNGTTDVARNVLDAGSLDAARRWVKIARTSKRHDAAKDLLLHTGVIEPLKEAGVQVGIQVVVGMPGAPAGPDPLGYHNDVYQTQTNNVGHTGQQVTATDSVPFVAKVIGESSSE